MAFGRIDPTREIRCFIVIKNRFLVYPLGSHGAARMQTL